MAHRRAGAPAARAPREAQWLQPRRGAFAHCRADAARQEAPASGHPHRQQRHRAGSRREAAPPLAESAGPGRSR